MKAYLSNQARSNGTSWEAPSQCRKMHVWIRFVFVGESIWHERRADSELSMRPLDLSR